MTKIYLTQINIIIMYKYIIMWSSIQNTLPGVANLFSTRKHGQKLAIWKDLGSVFTSFDHTITRCSIQ